ncbi:hypothetical protein BDF19DRAFT_410251 [Syncephalis fuscata]|nr:hypothetical protein BDF19DRAFT_410251 [Syncephalis fuscata]
MMHATHSQTTESAKSWLPSNQHSNAIAHRSAEHHSTAPRTIGSGDSQHTQAGLPPLPFLISHPENGSTSDSVSNYQPTSYSTPAALYSNGPKPSSGHVPSSHQHPALISARHQSEHSNDTRSPTKISELLSPLPSKNGGFVHNRPLITPLSPDNYNDRREVNKQAMMARDRVLAYPKEQHSIMLRFGQTTPPRSFEMQHHLLQQQQQRPSFTDSVHYTKHAAHHSVPLNRQRISPSTTDMYEHAAAATATSSYTSADSTSYSNQFAHTERSDEYARPLSYRQPAPVGHRFYPEQHSIEFSHGLSKANTLNNGLPKTKTVLPSLYHHQSAPHLPSLRHDSKPIAGLPSVQSFDHLSSCYDKEGRVHDYNDYRYSSSYARHTPAGYQQDAVKRYQQRDPPVYSQVTPPADVHYDSVCQGHTSSTTSIQQQRSHQIPTSHGSHVSETMAYKQSGTAHRSTLVHHAIKHEFADNMHSSRGHSSFSGAIHANDALDISNAPMPASHFNGMAAASQNFSNFHESSMMRRAHPRHDELARKRDTGRKWLLDNFEPAPPRFSIQRRTLHQYYIQYAERVDPEGELLDLANFGRLVVSTFPGIRSRRLGQRRMSTYSYIGIHPKDGSYLLANVEAIVRDDPKYNGNRVTAKKGRPQTEAQRVAQQRRRSRFAASEQATTDTKITNLTGRRDTAGTATTTDNSDVDMNTSDHSPSPQPDSMQHTMAADAYSDMHSCDSSEFAEEPCEDAAYSHRNYTDREYSHDHTHRELSLSASPASSMRSTLSINLSTAPPTANQPIRS